MYNNHRRDNVCTKNRITGTRGYEIAGNEAGYFWESGDRTGVVAIVVINDF